MTPLPPSPSLPSRSSRPPRPSQAASAASAAAASEQQAGHDPERQGADDPALDLGPDEAAGDWFVRRRQADWSAAEERQFQSWLTAAPRHRQAFDEAEATWVDFAEVVRPSLASDGHRPVAASRGATAPTPRRRLVPAALAASLAIAALAWYGWGQAPSFTLEVATAAGETRQVTLPDGSTVDLNFSSKLAVNYYARRRDVSLVAGEAFFDVTADPARPFSVDSGPSQITVVGTRFNVRTEAGGFAVKVLEGRVEVIADRRGRDPDRRSPMALGANQGVTVAVDGNANGGPGAAPLRIVGYPAERIGDWRTGRLVFRRTPIAEVAREVARYIGEPVVVDADPRLQALPVSGFADTRAPTSFLAALPDSLPVRVARTADGRWRISAR